MVQGIRDVVATTTEIMSSEITTTMIDAVSKAFGMVTIQPYLSLARGTNNVAETTYIGGDILSALGGNPQLVAVLRGLQTLAAGGAAADTILNQLGPSSIPRKQDGSIDYVEFAKSIGKGMENIAINGTTEFFKEIGDKFKEAVNLID